MTVTRSMEATDATGAAAVARERRGLASGWWGMALLIATEATLFVLIMATYYYLRFRSPHWPPPGLEKPKVALPMALTGGLVLTTIPMWLSVRAARAGRVARAWWLILIALFFQGGYLGVQIWQWLDDMHKLHPAGFGGSAYASIYLTMLFAHHAHVAIGCGLDLWLLFKLARGLTNYRLTGLRVIALYWYFVAAIAIPIVLTEVYPSL